MTENWMVIPNAEACFDVDMYGRQYELQCLSCEGASNDRECINSGEYVTCGGGSACYVSTSTADGKQTRGCMNTEYCKKENGRYVENCAAGDCDRCYAFEPGSPDPAKPWSRCITPDPCIDEYGDNLALQCVACTGAISEGACRDSGEYVTCAPENICYTEYTKEGGVRKMTRGCMPINDCTTESLDPMRQEDCKTDLAISNCLICDYFQEDPSPSKPWSKCIVLLPPDICETTEDLMCLSCFEEQSDEDCRLNGELKRCRSDQICYRLESQTETNVKLITRGCKDVTQCSTKALSATPPGLCWRNGYGHEICLQCDFFQEYPEPEKPWSDCVVGAPTNPCRHMDGSEANLQCLTCGSVSDDTECTDVGVYEYCNIGDICFRMESTDEKGKAMITRGCIPLSECNEDAMGEGQPGFCSDFNSTITCYWCDYFQGSPSWSKCGVTLPPSPCLTSQGEVLELDCLTCENEPSDAACRENGVYVDCPEDNMCFRSEVTVGSDVFITRGCVPLTECSDAMFEGEDCGTNGDNNNECKSCSYFDEPEPIPMDRPWHRCMTPNPCKVYEDLYCLVLNCTAPPGEELDICELCPDPGYFENCGQTATCAKISTFDKRGLLVGLRRGCVEIDECPTAALWTDGPGVCFPSVYGLAHRDCIQCDYFLDEPPRFHTQGTPWSKCVDRPPDYPCERPDLLQCLTCYNQPTDDDCVINSFYDFCDGIENATCFRSEIRLAHGQTIISRGCRNRTECGETLMGQVCSHPAELSEIETCEKCDYFAPIDLLDPAYPWYKCQTPEVGKCICTDTQCWPFDVPKQLLNPGMHVQGHCLYDLIRDDCFQEGPANLTVVATFDRDREWIQEAHLVSLNAKWNYPPGPVEVRLTPGPQVAVRNYQTGFLWEQPPGDYSVLYPMWEEVTNAPGINIYTNYTAMEGPIWAATNGSIIIVVRMPNNMIIKWNGLGTFEIELPVAYEGDTCGICGNFDGDPDNEDICYGAPTPMYIPNVEACFEVDQFGRQFELQCLTCTDASSATDCVNSGEYVTCGEGSACYVSEKDGKQSRGCINPVVCKRVNGKYVDSCSGGECLRCYIIEPGSPDPAKPWSRCITPDPCIDEYGDNMALKCVTCTGATSEADCRNEGNYVTCAPDNICYMEFKKEGGIRKMTRGCIPINDCSTESLDPLKQEECRTDLSIGNCLICDYFQEDPTPIKPWSLCFVLAPPDICDPSEDIMCLTCFEEQTDEACRLNGELKRCQADQICYRLESQTETNVKLITRGCKDVTQCSTKALSTAPPGLCWRNGYGHEICLQCDYFQEFPLPDKPWSNCVVAAPPNPCKDAENNEVNLKCLTCNQAADDDACRAEGSLEYCSLGDICFRMESNDPNGNRLISRGCIPLGECNEDAVKEGTKGFCNDFNGTETCYQCSYFLESPVPSKPWSQCGVTLPVSPCLTSQDEMLELDCLTCEDQASDADCRTNGAYEDCPPDNMCFRREVQDGNNVLISRGCIAVTECTDDMFSDQGDCGTNDEGNNECTTCSYFKEISPIPLDRPWHRCMTPNPCKVYENLYCLVLNCTAPPGEELDICELCPDPGYFEDCGQTATCAKISTFDKRGLLVGLRRGCIEIDECPTAALWNGGPGVCFPSVYGLAHRDCIECDYFLDEPPRYHTQGTPWSKCEDRPPDYPCTRPDLLQCLTCYNQPTDEDCVINSFYEFCEGVENTTCFRSEIRLAHGQTIISRGCRNRTVCGEPFMGEVCSHPTELSDIETCDKCDYFAPVDLLDPAYPWYKCQTPEVGICVCTDTRCWPFDVPKQLLNPGMHVMGHCLYDLIRDDCFQEGPANMTVVAKFERDQHWVQEARLHSLFAKWNYPPGPVEVRLTPGPGVKVRNLQTGFVWEMPEGDYSDLVPYWEDVTNAPGVELSLNKTSMKGEIWAVTNSSIIIVTRMPNNMLIKWNGQGTFEIELPVAYEGDTCGICGNFDGDPDNEDLCYGIIRSSL